MEFNCKNFALILEMYSFYQDIRVMDEVKLNNLKQKISVLYNEYQENSKHRKNIKISLMHLLIYYIEQCVLKEFITEAENSKKKLYELDEELCRFYLKNKQNKE